jgi:outer membrane protein assembly factor BamD
MALAVLMVAGLPGCSGDGGPEYVERPVEQLYNDGLINLEQGDYEQAADAFKEVERQHPYSVWATKANLMAAYSHYEDNEYDDAIIALDRFIQLHPGNRDVAYAYYLKALCYYEQIADVRRDQEMTRLAMNALREVQSRFPDSKYARDARFKSDLARDHMAGKDMSVGRFYLSEKHYLAALNRFKSVVDQYEQTTHVPEALYRIVEVNTILGLTEEARKVAAVLGYNYPGSEWYVDAYQLVTGEQIRDPSEETGWYDGLFDWL